MAPLSSSIISHLEKPWVHVNRVGMGSHGCRALSDRSPLFLSDFPNIHTPSLIFLPRVVPPLSSFSWTPNASSESLPCQAITQCQHQSSQDAKRKRCHSFQPTHPLHWSQPHPHGPSLNPSVLHKNTLWSPKITYAHFLCLSSLHLRSFCLRLPLTAGCFSVCA